MARCRPAALFLFAFSALAVIPLAQAQFVSLVGGTPPVQTFDTLASSGTSSVLPDGWHLSESDDNANTTYSAGDGSVGSGDTYSFGSSSSTERAFGTLRSGSLISIIGAQLRNDSGNALSSIDVSYVGEQWRLGTAGRSDGLSFQYSLNATGLADSAATWVSVGALDFTAPLTGGSLGALDGNLAANRTQISASISGINLAVGASLWVRWLDVSASGADDGLGIDDVSFGVDGEPPADVAPTVASTTPLDGAVNVALAASLAVTFSEPVTATQPWFTLECANSGIHTATVSGGPTSYSLNPDTDFGPAETCTWTILASGIVDQDGDSADPLAANVVIDFTTFDPSSVPPPSVLSTLPANGASNVPAASDIRVTFSETVTTTPAAFALSCNGNGISLTESGSGDRRTLTPATLLPANGQCHFSIDPDEVRNGFDVPMAAPFAIDFSVSGGDTSAYYSPVNTSTSEQLRCSLHQVIRGHTAYPYSGSGTNAWTILEAVQVNPSNSNQIIDVYRNRAYATVTDRAGGGSAITYNREHTWPNSLGFPGSTGNLGLPNAPYTDTHMLWLSDTGYNADRGNKPYANCPQASGCGERSTESNGGVGGGSGSYPGNSNWVKGPDGNQGSFEVWNERKGEMARAIFYMAIRYEGGVDPVSGQNEPELELTDIRSNIVQMNNYNQTAYMGLLTDLLAWHQADPPDAAEIARNDTIQLFQGNRNPFVDHPEWATRALFESSNPATCVLGDDTLFVDGFDPPTSMP